MRLTFANALVSLTAGLILAGLASAIAYGMYPSEATSYASSLLCGFSALIVGFFSFAIPFDKQAEALERTWVWRFKGFVRPLLRSQKWRLSSIVFMAFGLALLATRIV
jgi:hypothetical protein